MEKMKGLVQQFNQINEELFRKAKNPLKCHGPDHHRRVWQNALWISKQLKSKFDPKILIPACFLHDITAYEENDNPKVKAWKHQEDLVEAQKILREIKYPADKSAQVLKVIAVHGSDPKTINRHEPIEATLLRDADKMDIFGPLGIARIIMPLSRHGYSLNEIVQKFYDEGYLKRKYRAIQTAPAKRAVKADFQYSLHFFRDLKKALNNSSNKL